MTAIRLVSAVTNQSGGSESCQQGTPEDGGVPGGAAVSFSVPVTSHWTDLDTGEKICVAEGGGSDLLFAASL